MMQMSEVLLRASIPGVRQLTLYTAGYFLLLPLSQPDQVTMDSWISRGDPAEDRGSLSVLKSSSSLSSPPPLLKSPKQRYGGSISHLEIVSSPCGFTDRQAGLRRHGTFKPPSNNGFEISQLTAVSSRSLPLPLFNYITLSASLSFLVFLSVFLSPLIPDSASVLLSLSSFPDSYILYQL